MHKIRTLIAEDEPVSLRRVRRILENEPDIEVVAETKNGTETIREIRRMKLDLVCLDIQMPVMGGFEVIRAIGPEKMPHILFVTAYDKYALQAFDANAVDYLLKPFSEDRFRKALDRVRRQIELRRSGDLSHKIEALLQAVGSGSKTVRIMVKTGDRTLFLNAGDITWAEAAGNYVNLHSSGKSYLYRSALGKLTEELGADRFIRINRSTMVNKDHIVEIQKLFQGEHWLILKNGAKLELNHRYAKRAFAVMQKG
jgi:two-component system LytT family response regulator